jgi:hypothetical protein
MKRFKSKKRSLPEAVKPRRVSDLERISMIRYATIAISAFLYLAVSVWLVGKQGQAYREGLGRDRVATTERKKPRPTEPELQDEAPRADEPAIAATEPDATPPAAAAVPKPSTSKKTRERTKQGRQTAKGTSKAKPAEPSVAHESPKHPTEKAATAADPLAANPFWTQPEMMRNWDVANLSAAEEQKLGAQLHDIIMQLNPVAASGPWRQRVEDAAKPFLAAVQRKDIRYHFEIMESDQVNAFSHPGGYVYVNRGLFELIGEDEDYALQFAVGTEIAHVDRKHALRCLEDPDFKSMSGGTIRKLYWVVMPLGYLVSDTVNQDFDADEWTASRMRSFGRSKRETLAFLYKLDGYAKRHGFGDGQGKVRLGVDSASFLDIHYRRQTAAWKRLENLKQKIK